MASDQTGVQLINIEGNLATYSAVVIDYTPYTTATDMFVLQNPATSTNIIRINQIKVSGVATAASMMDIYTNIRTALNTGGTAAGVTAAKHDSNDVAPVGVAQTYSVAPTLNGTAALVRADRVMLPASGTPTAGSFITWDFGVRGGAKCPRLRPGQQLSINNNSNAVAAGTSMYMVIEWTEGTPVQ